MGHWHNAGYTAVNKLNIDPSSHGSNIVIGGGQSTWRELSIYSVLNSSCWGRSWRGLDPWLTHKLNSGNGRLQTPPLPSPRNVYSVHHSHSQSYFQGLRLERVMCGWDILDWIRDWNPLKPLHKLLRFWQRVWHQPVLWCPRQTWQVGSHDE